MSRRASLWALMFGNLAIGTGVMIVAGVLSELAADLQISPPVAGQLISAAAIVMALGAPIAAAATSGFDRRLLLALTLAWYALGLIASAFATTFPQLLGIRMVTVISAAIFTPQAAATAALLAPPDERGRAMAFTFLGWSIASVFGVPVGSWLSGAFGWRIAFVVTGLLAGVGSVAVIATLPAGLRVQRLSLKSWVDVARHPLLPRVLFVTVLMASGQFGVFAFIAPYLLWLVEADANGRAVALAWFGAFGLWGNVLVARRIDKLGPDRAVQLTLTAVLVGVALLPAGRGGILLAALALAVWGSGLFGSNSSQQVRLAAIAPPLASGSIALNTSAIYLGQAIGTAAGGLVYARAGIDYLSWFGTALIALALALSMTVSRRRKQKGPVA
ncbi:MAG TPA: MFS transporter [Burkholderiaceae bacterium]|nr:MFS transporter [Burkholderiaceae bacterium]